MAECQRANCTNQQSSYCVVCDECFVELAKGATGPKETKMKCMREGCTNERTENSVLCAGCFGELAAGAQPKIHKDDEGPLAMAIGHHEGTVVIDFGKRVKWIGLDPKSAKELAGLIIDNANKAEEGK